MKTATISELKNGLSAFLDIVRRGETVLVLDRRAPVARIEPVSPWPADQESGLLSELERGGLLRRGTGTLPRGFLEQPLPTPGRSVLEALLEERREGR